MTNFTPYLLFDGTCAEAMNFYRTCFGGKLTQTTVGDSPMKAQFPAGKHARIINARLVSDVVDISASDWMHPTERPKQGNTVCLYLSEGTLEELKTYFDRLADGAGSASVTPLSQQPFGMYGALTDRYGIRWMFHGAAAP